MYLVSMLMHAGRVRSLRWSPASHGTKERGGGMNVTLLYQPLLSSIL